MSIKDFFLNVERRIDGEILRDTIKPKTVKQLEEELATAIAELQRQKMIYSSRINKIRSVSRELDHMQNYKAVVRKIKRSATLCQ